MTQPEPKAAPKLAGDSSADSAALRSSQLEQTDFDGEKPAADDDSHIDEDLIGTKLDHYAIYSFLGRGAMGRVYRGWNERLHRIVAVKVVAPELVRAEPERLEMFLREARTAAQLHHPHVVTVHSLGDDRGYTFIEMEFVKGTSLGKHLKDRRRLPPLEAARFVRQIASALHAAHNHNLLHCDIKPDNVMLSADGVAKLGDFGLARAFGGAPGSRKTVGTPFYMAPELFGAAPPSVATEVYALGVTFYNLLTGTVPFPARSMQELKDYALFSAAPDVAKVAPETPSKMAAIVAAMLDKDPLARPTVSLELLEELDELAIELIPTKEIVADAMADVEVKWEALDAERFRFKVTLPDDRSQTVEGETLEGEDGHKVMTFWTPCAPAAADHFRFVLELNGRLPFGAVSIRRMKDQDYFVMTSNHPRATLDPEEVRAAVLKMAQWADHIEHRLTGQDVH